MSTSKYFDKIAWSVTALVLALTILFMNGASLGMKTMTHAMGYENRLFDNTRVHTIDIAMDDWDEFIENAISEEYYAADVVIDGEARKNVGIRAKGNTSLSTVAILGSQRYSFKIEFDQYDSSKSYYGLDKLSLNNLIQDSTMMKDYLTYTMMREFGVNTPLCSFAYITVNGEDWGLYLAVEGVEEAFLQRNYGSDYGKLYKPDSLSFGGGRGNGGEFDMKKLDFDEGNAGPPEPGGTSQRPVPPAAPGGGENDSPGNGFGFGGGFGMGASDVKLQYINDQPDSYSNIWNNAKTDITEADQNRLIASLRHLSNGEDISAVIDIEQVIRYFVVHNYVCNGDSYTGSMIHNYYLYEENGRLAMIPWDYNLAFGTFRGSDATDTVNTPIDSPVDGGLAEDRPMWNWIASNEECAQLYHRYFSEFMETVDIAGIIEDAYDLIKPYVEKDPTAFYTGEEFESGVQTLRQFCRLRSESISMQLKNGQTAENMNYADASGITLSDMGSMEGMGGRGGFDANAPGRPGDGANSSDRSGRGEFEPAPEEISDEFIPSGAPEGFDPSGGSDTPSGGDAKMPAGGFPPGEAGSFAPDEDGSFPPDMASGVSPDRGGGGAPDGAGNAADRAGAETAASDMAGWIWLAVSASILGAGLVIAKKYRD